MWGLATNESLAALNMTLAILRRLKWPLTLMFYAALIDQMPIFAGSVLAGLMVAAYQAYQVDLKREQDSSDDFTRGGLFYRYGSKVSEALWPIPIKPEWNTQETEQFAADLRKKFAERLRTQLPESVNVLEPVVITDKGRGLKKEFVRIFARTELGSTIVHFFHFAPFGRSITLHYSSFLRGTHTWFDVVKLMVFAPFTLWVWGLPWARNEFSVISKISNFAESSYDDMDIGTVFSTSRYMVLTETRTLLEEEGVLTEEVSQMILNQITNVQSFNLAHSTGANIGSISQSASSSTKPQAA